MNPALPLAVPAFSARPLTSRRMNTCRSASKQATSSLFRMNTYAKVPGGGRGSKVPFSNSRSAATTLLPVSLLACRPWIHGRPGASRLT